MLAPSCTVEADSEDDARCSGAARLGARPEDVRAAPLAAGRWRVELVRAVFAIEVATAQEDREGLVTRIRPALGDAPPPTRADVVRALADAGITAGLLDEEIERMLARVAGEGRELTDVVVARGAPPLHGSDARLVPCRPLPEPGSAARLALVRDGDVVLEREPATAGTPGYTVRGAVLAAQPGAELPKQPGAELPKQPGAEPRVEVGEGIDADPDGRRWRASVVGFGWLEADAAGRLRVVPGVALSADRLGATVDLRPPRESEVGALGLTRAELEAAVAAAGIRHGLQARRVRVLVDALGRRAPRCVVRIAYGTPPRAGRDARLELAVPVGLGAGAIEAATGRIDWRERGLAVPVSRGQRIGTWWPATAGEDGIAVDGSPLPAAHGARAEPDLGANVASEPDGVALALRSTIDGAVVLPAPGRVEVADVLDLPKDVDYATGNLDVRGCIHVHGTVRGGFRVTAEHDVSVGDSVEDAVVEAGGAVDVARGILGGSAGRVVAKERVSARHAQNATIRCGGDVVLRDSAVNCDVECGGELVAVEGHGRLQGGRYAATRGVRARELGSASAASTLVVVGTFPAVERELATVRAEERRLRAAGRKLQRTLGAASAERPAAGMSREGAAGARKLMKARRDLARLESALDARRRQLVAELAAHAPPVVEVLVRTHPGVEVRILDATLRVEDVLEAARFRYDAALRRIEVVFP